MRDEKVTITMPYSRLKKLEQIEDENNELKADIHRKQIEQDLKLELVYSEGGFGWSKTIRYSKGDSPNEAIERLVRVVQELQLEKENLKLELCGIKNRSLLTRIINP